MAESRNQVALYAAVGPELTHYAVDVEGAALERRGILRRPPISITPGRMLRPAISMSRRATAPPGSAALPARNTM